MSEWTKLLKFAMQYNTEKMTEFKQIVWIRKKATEKISGSQCSLRGVLPQGLEPWTPTLRVSCSTN